MAIQRTPMANPRSAMHQAAGRLQPLACAAEMASTGNTHWEAAPAASPNTPRSLRRNGGREYATARTSPPNTNAGAARSPPQNRLSATEPPAVNTRKSDQESDETLAARLNLPARKSQPRSATSLTQ